MRNFISLLSLFVFIAFYSCDVENVDEPALDSGITSDFDQRSTEEDCETGFAFYKEGCFIDDEDYSFKRWGWVLGPLGDGFNGNFDIYAAAGKCDIDKGFLAGSVQVQYSGGTVTVDLTAEEGYAFYETHVYVGNDKFPTHPKNGKPTVAPGQYGNKHDFPDGTTSDSYEIEGLSGDVYVIVHVVVCEYEEPCEVYPGKLTAEPKVCLKNEKADLLATPSGTAVVPDGYQVLYVLTEGPGLVIVDVNTEPSFVVDSVGNYTIHTLVYNPETLDLSIVELGVTTGFDVFALLIDGGGDICAALDVTGAPIQVEKCD